MLCSLILLLIISVVPCSWCILSFYILWFKPLAHISLALTDGNSLRPVLKMGTPRTDLYLFLRGVLELHIEVYFKLNSWLEVVFFLTPRYSMNLSCKPVWLLTMLQILRDFFFLSLHLESILKTGNFPCHFWGVEGRPQIYL